MPVGRPLEDYTVREKRERGKKSRESWKISLNMCFAFFLTMTIDLWTILVKSFFFFLLYFYIVLLSLLLWNSLMKNYSIKSLFFFFFGFLLLIYAMLIKNADTGFNFLLLRNLKIQLKKLPSENWLIRNQKIRTFYKQIQTNNCIKIFLIVMISWW